MKCFCGRRQANSWTVVFSVVDLEVLSTDVVVQNSLSHDINTWGGLSLLFPPVTLHFEIENINIWLQDLAERQLSHQWNVKRHNNNRFLGLNWSFPFLLNFLVEFLLFPFWIWTLFKICCVTLESNLTARMQQASDLMRSIDKCYQAVSAWLMQHSQGEKEEDSAQNGKTLSCSTPATLSPPLQNVKINEQTWKTEENTQENVFHPGEHIQIWKNLINRSYKN